MMQCRRRNSRGCHNDLMLFGILRSNARLVLCAVESDRHVKEPLVVAVVTVSGYSRTVTGRLPGYGFITLITSLAKLV